MMEQQAVTNILITGVGGQGTLLTSRILAQAAVDMGYDVKVSEVHGMAQRGGSVVTQVRFGQKVFSPLIGAGDADLLLAFEPIEGARWLEFLKPSGTVIVNDEPIDPLPVLNGAVPYPRDIIGRITALTEKCYVFNCSEAAAECGNRRAANVVMVGILTCLTGFPAETVTAALRKIVPPKTLEVNLRAFARGMQLMG
jgi:indolepyruvate ferredoxin oxidoreductase beta subunit